MFTDFYVINTINKLRDIYLKCKILIDIHNKIKITRNIINIQCVIRGYNTRKNIKNKKENNMQILKGVIRGWLVRYNMTQLNNKIKNTDKINRGEKLYVENIGNIIIPSENTKDEIETIIKKIDYNKDMIKEMFEIEDIDEINQNEEIDQINNVIEINIRDIIRENKMVTIELDNVINDEIKEISDDKYYEKELNKGLDGINEGVYKNTKGCHLCCCGLYQLCGYLCYHLKKNISSLFNKLNDK